MRHRITTKGGRTLRTSNPERFASEEERPSLLRRMAGKMGALPENKMMDPPANKSTKKERKDAGKKST